MLTPLTQTNTILTAWTDWANRINNMETSLQSLVPKFFSGFSAEDLAKLQEQFIKSSAEVAKLSSMISEMSVRALEIKQNVPSED